MLFHEFDNIFHDIFSRKAATYREIARFLVDGPKTLTQTATALERKRGGSLSAALDDLEEAGFIRKDISFDPGSGRARPRLARFRLSDCYLRFFLRYVDPVREQIRKGLYQWAPLESLQAWNTIMGFQFESLVLNSLETLLAKMGLENVPVLNAGPYFQKQTRRVKGCQIDLLIRTRQSLYICEIKFRKQIPKSVMSETRQKVDRLALPDKHPIRTVLIYAGQLDPKIKASDFFDILVPARVLLER